MMTAAQCGPAATETSPPASLAIKAAQPGLWLRAAFAVTVIGWGANQFTPLLLLAVAALAALTLAVTAWQARRTAG